MKTIPELIQAYKTHISHSQLAEEKYKWELLTQYKGRPDVKAEDFTKEIESLNFTNLLYPMGVAVLKGIAKQKPEELRACFVQLFDETKDLNGRLATFKDETLKLYREMGQDQQHHQDERSMSTYLTYRFPEKYTFYKATLYKKLCEMMEVEKLKTGSRVPHYYELLDQFVDNNIVKDADLISMVNSYLPKDVYKGNLRLIGQDFLYTMFDKKESIKTEKEVSFEKFIEHFDKKELEIYFDFLGSILQELGLNLGDERVSFNYYDSSLYFIVGQRYGWCLEDKNKVKTFRVLSEEPISEDGEYFDGESNKAFLNNFSQWEPTEVDLSNVLSGLKNTLSRTKKSGYRKFNKEDFEQFAYQLIKLNSPMKTLNQIMYGPPGTGKTYATIDKVVEICEPMLYSKDHVSNKRVYDNLVEEGRVIFITFHQSLGYEDFIEGIKPMVPEEGDHFLRYEVVNGIFKEIAETAKAHSEASINSISQITIDPKKFHQNINKISLGNSLDPADKVIFDYCMDNDCVAIGFGEEIDFSGVKNRTEIRERYRQNGIEIQDPMDFNISAIERLVLWMKPGELVFVSWGNRTLKAIGEVTGEYYVNSETPISYSQFRKVKWLYKDLSIPIKDIYPKFFSQQSIYQMNGGQIDWSYFSQGSSEKRDKKNFVLVIDEINRGNVSAIFGELITLLEEDKRLGANNELKIDLPYSKEKFGVPSNLYVIGTMNTADRSVEALDTALRRRFSFHECMPDPLVLKDNLIGSFNLSELLIKINSRIEALIDRDHTIGHAYLISVNNMDDLRLAFKDKIIPLLQEYFYGDYGKIGLVLGEGFVRRKSVSHEIFSSFHYEGRESLVQESYELIPFDTLDFETALSKL